MKSVVDEPQLSYYPVHVGNPTENCFFQFTLETQQKTASSSPWISNRKLFPDHLSSILHGPPVGSDTERERERGEREEMKRLWRE
jgi:hypothetical protein